MSARKKTKLCWHCHGTIPAEMTHCAYCGEDCDSSQPPGVPYFPPYSQQENSSDSIENVSAEIEPDIESPVTDQDQRTSKSISTYLSSVKCSWHHPMLSILCLIWGIFAAFLALTLCAFSNERGLYLQLPAQNWWKFALLASAFLWISSLLPQISKDEHQDN